MERGAISFYRIAPFFHDLIKVSIVIFYWVILLVETILILSGGSKFLLYNNIPYSEPS